MLQSNLQSGENAYPISQALGPITRAKQWRLLRYYTLLAAIGVGLILMVPMAAVQTFGLGLLLPGLGFLPTIFAQGDAGAMLMLLAVIATFGAALVIWFATGNVILPCLTWLGLAVLAMRVAPSTQAASFLWVPMAVLAAMTCHRYFQAWVWPVKRKALNQALTTYQTTASPTVSSPDALSDEDLACLRLLLDRALQPVDEFNGFDVLDQFQTAALRYQLNFTSYALSVVQAKTMPAFAGYMAEAQSNLNAKQADPKVWGYWKLENSWGNFDTNGDPFARDNIMYSGFVAAQLLYQQKAVSYPVKAPAMTCTSKSGDSYYYDIHDIIGGLVDQYKQASYGLLPCEPNWVFPLCNAITATAIRAYDAVYHTTHWADIAPAFQQHLEAEFISPNGQFIPFRSSYTGFAPPAIGGAVMQSFPCLFFNAALPNIAKRQWAAMQIDRAGRDWKSIVWPVDVGNYGFSRAAGYTATAAAAQEMGDSHAAQDLQDALAQELPATTRDGIAHRPNASIWAHANEMLSRVLRADTLRSLVTDPMLAQTPYLKSAPYRDVLVAKAIWEDDALTCVLVPTDPDAPITLTIAGLRPHAQCRVSGVQNPDIIADDAGEIILTVRLSGRTKVIIHQTKGA
jgi:hypothetical protein